MSCLVLNVGMSFSRNVSRYFLKLTAVHVHEYVYGWIMHEAYIMRVNAPTSLYHWPCMERG